MASMGHIHVFYMIGKNLQPKPYFGSFGQCFIVC